MKRDVIIPLDFPGAGRVFEFLELFGQTRPYVKVGMELFYAEGPDVVRKLKERGHRVFVDLKLHDIPNTVAGGMRSLARLGADMCNLHASGTGAMMRAALEALTDEGAKLGRERPLLIAVTQLTSTSEEAMRGELLIGGDMPGVVAHYAGNARACGLDGVVCSPLEAALIKKTCGADFVTVTPGVRFADAGGGFAGAGDQARIATPASAREGGSDYIVVGRPITAAKDPVEAYERCMKDFVR